MGDNFTFPDYEGRLMKVIEKFGGEKLETYRGKDVTRLWDMKGGSLKWSFKHLYTAPKLEKIVFGIQCYNEKLMTYTTSVWPDDNHALPIYSNFWAEAENGSYFLVDLYPTADCVMDDPYLEHYFEPVVDAYDKALQDFNIKNSRDPNWYKTLCSPCYITADFKPSTKETQGRVLDTMVDYLEVYYDLWEKDEPRSPEYMEGLNIRKTAIRKSLWKNDMGGFMLEKAVGKELAELTLDALF